MKIVFQRVKQASVEVAGKTVGAIGVGALILLGVAHDDTDADLAYLVKKTAQLRVFNDEEGRLNASIQDVGGSFLVVSQFTLYGDVKKGNRPGYVDAAPPEQADAIYQQFKQALRDLGFTVESGVFQADMAVSLVNDGPVTIIMESRGRS